MHQPTKTHRAVLFLASLMAMVIGASILLTPAQFHASNGIELAASPSLFSEVRAPGAALLVLGALMMVGVFVRSFALAATVIAAAVYLSYGLARLVSMGLDGIPAQGLVAATVIELVTGTLCIALLLHARRGARRLELGEAV